jgi:hypothetical protein
MLHIHNGDSAAEIARDSTIPGEHFAWREALIDGPTPAGTSKKKWRETRAQHLAESYFVDYAQADRDLRNQEEKLTEHSEHEEVVLWFEHDLFCQINLVYLLNWFAEHKSGNTKLSLICIGEFEGLPAFRGLGELNPEQMTSLFGTRHEVTDREKALAKGAWKAYCSPDPTAIQRLLETDPSALPFLKDALQLHLERFPFVSNGLGRIQQRGLELIKGGARTFVDLFPRFWKTEPTYGLGDLQFWNALRRMNDVSEPLLKIKNGKAPDPVLTPQNIHQITFEMTEAGDSVLNGEADFIELNGIDTWLGGVHLFGKEDVWRWDGENQTLTQT